MARLVRAIYSSTCAATGGPDTPGHDDAGTFPATGQVSDFAVVAEMYEFGRDTPGHDDRETTQHRPRPLLRTQAAWLRHHSFVVSFIGSTFTATASV
jgi:hypothetical protein